MRTIASLRPFPMSAGNFVGNTIEKAAVLPISIPPRKKYLVYSLVGCVTAAGPGWPGRQAECSAGGPGGLPGCPWRWGRTLVRHALFRYQTRAPLPGPTLPGRRRPWGTGMSTWSWPSPRARGGGHRPVHPPTQTTSPGPDAGPDTLVSYNGGGGDAFPGLNRERPSLGPGIGRGGLPAGLLSARHPAPEADHPPPPGGRSTRRAAPQPAGPPFFPVWPGSPTQMFCSQFVYRMLRLAGLHYFRKDPPSRCAPWTLWTWMPRGLLTLVAAYTWVGGPPAGPEARPLQPWGGRPRREGGGCRRGPACGILPLHLTEPTREVCSMHSVKSILCAGGTPGRGPGLVRLWDVPQEAPRRGRRSIGGGSHLRGLWGGPAGGKGLCPVADHQSPLLLDAA